MNINEFILSASDDVILLPIYAAHVLQNKTSAVLRNCRYCRCCDVMQKENTPLNNRLGTALPRTD